MSTHALSTAPACGMVVDHTCDDEGEINGDIECGEYAEWQDECGNPVCTSCYYEHTFADRARFTYVDKLEGLEEHCEPA